MAGVRMIDTTCYKHCVIIALSLYGVTGKMRIWFRHSGQPPVSWWDARKGTTKSYTIAEVKHEVGSYDITALKLEETIPSNIGEFASKALCLCVSNLTDRASLDK